MKFSKDFIFGTATSSFQIEGARHINGKTDSIWDNFCDINGKIVDNSNGDIACNHYELYEEDIKLMSELGLDAYRFSISWPRIYPKKGEYNPKGMEFYINILKTLKKYNIKAYITLYHWDLPMWIHNEGGWTTPIVVDYFKDYAIKCFEHLDEFVDGWITLNEPHCSSVLGYLHGNHAPGHQNVLEMIKSTHYLLLAHAKTVNYYKDKYNKKIGITLNLNHVKPNSDKYEDIVATNNADGYLNRWFLDPLFKGYYPLDIINLLLDDAKDISFIKEDDLKIIKTDIDFLGVNYYSGGFIEYCPDWLFKFKKVDKGFDRTFMGWDVYPEGLYLLVKRLREDYTDLPIYITENGAAYDDRLIDGKIFDNDRIEYLNKHLNIVSKLNDEKMNIKGYFLWSFMDNFEWAHGYTKRFGIIYVDYKDLKRYKKESFYEYKKIIEKR